MEPKIGIIWSLIMSCSRYPGTTLNLYLTVMLPTIPLLPNFNCEGKKAILPNVDLMATPKVKIPALYVQQSRLDSISGGGGTSGPLHPINLSLVRSVPTRHEKRMSSWINSRRPSSG